jgi:glutamate synthase (NADPH/NADH) large chain
MASLGLRTINEMVGRADLLETRQAIDHWKARGLDFSKILTPAEIVYEGTQVYRTMSQDHGLEKALDNVLIELAQPALLRGEKVRIEHPVININRVVGTTLSHEVAKATEGKLLPDDTIHIKLTGTAGQSLGAWLAKGITLEVEGDCNDYVGKGLSGGKIIVYPPKSSTFKAEDNILIGNVVMYGATSGECYFRGIGAERFCVRNSGATAVVEGIGDHGCEYMTGGRVVVLGKTGRNFGAGMSGGIAYVWNKDGNFERMCNTESFELERMETAEDIRELRTLLENHQNYTGSTVAGHILDNWKTELARFVKVMPTEYKRSLAEMAGAKVATAAVGS